MSSYYDYLNPKPRPQQRVRDLPSVKRLHRLMIFLGYVYLALYVLGEFDVLDFHVYIGPDATAWHQRHSSE